MAGTPCEREQAEGRARTGRDAIALAALCALVGLTGEPVARAQIEEREASAAQAQAPEEPPDRVAPEEPREVPLSAGFTPDPVRLEGATAGALPLSARAPGCRGYVGERADHVLRLETRFGFLRLFVIANAAVTLAMRGPDGTWHCSGRPLLGVPREEGAFEAGRYEVWIGSAQPSTQVPHELHVTEFRSVAPGRTPGEIAAIGLTGDIGLDDRARTGRFRDRRLRRGFLPDPREDGGVAGGPIVAALLGAGCRGYVEAQPSHVLELRDDFDYLRIHVREPAGAVTLVVRTPAGGYVCSAPEDGLPSVENDAWRRGQYRIWVGSRAPDLSPRYRLEYTETRAASP